MSVGEIGTMTLVKVKEFSMSTFIKFTKIMQGISKLRLIVYSRKQLVVSLVVWFVAIVAGYFVYQFEATRTNDAFYQQGLSAAQSLATKSGPFVLEKDVLALNVAVKEFQEMEDLNFAAITDHEDTILTHTDSEMINRKFESLQNQRPIDTIDEIRITAGLSPDKTEVVGFSRNITFSGVEIGKVYIALSATHLSRTLDRLRFIYLSGAILATILLAVVLFWLNRVATARSLKVRQDIESTKRIGPYFLRRKVARGGMAELFLADYVRQDGFRRKVAVKRILPHLVENPDFIKMFTREARLAALLQHPNIVQIFDYGKIENAYFIAMEYIDGKNLGEIISAHDQGLLVDHAVFIISEICKGLDYSHKKRDDNTGEPFNIVHRDISPQNLLISYQGEVKISDFGISKARSEPSLTQAGVIKGKLAYLSPEQALGETVDHRADIYALGLVFYEALTGKRVYRFSSDIEAIRAIPKMEIDPLANAMPQIPEGLNRIVMKCLEKRRDLRYHDASALYADLAAFRRELKITLDASDLADFMKKSFKETGKSSNTK
ncbi:MAG: protein kinase [Proteobacteria bacterium]|nr:protein kinase [Pseudomonadota bacterium]